MAGLLQGVHAVHHLVRVARWKLLGSCSPHLHVDAAQS